MCSKYNIRNQPKIWLDIDGVLADFSTHYLDCLGFENKESPRDWRDPRFVEYFETIRLDPEFWAGIPALLSSKDIPFIVSGYCTSRDIELEVTEEWLFRTNLFPVAPVISVGVGHSKLNSLRENGCELFIDDSIYNYVELNNGGIDTYLYTRPHNVKYKVVKRLISLYNLMEFDYELEPLPETVSNGNIL